MTAAKALEEALIESEQRYRLIAEHACDIVARLSCSGEILYISPAAETLFGVAPEHLASRRISSVARREYQGIVRDSVERCATRRTPTDVTFQVDVPGFGIRSFEMSLRHVAPVEDSRTGVSLVAIIRDFTSRLRDIERMNRLGGILDRAHDLVLTACPIAGVITYANRSARDKLALDLVAGLGLTMGSIVPQMDLETIRSLCKQGNDRRTSPPVETEFLREGRTPVPVEVVFQMIDGLQAGTDTVVVIARDISARREIEEVRQDLISTLSHELRTPLSSLHAALDIVVHDLPSDLSLEAGQMLEVALRSSGRLIALTNDLLDISRIEAGVLELQPAAHDLSGLLRDAIETASPLARTGAVTLSLVEGGSGVGVMIDAERFLQIVGNLLNNAIKFSPRGSRVEVAFEECHGVAEVRIVDHGCGVAPDFLPRLFTKFAKDSQGWQAGRPMAGTGLGLPIARALAEAMGGAIHHENTPGGGATFVLAIPLEQR